ncbi:hypothetical protein QUF81_00440 [Peribacillus simplex]|uniref:hypothetical protein n=1 Tax=Peribacillus simplex TaxID=1478 RepID=UPI0025A0037F|nr:hypothetical protein [Peribacillus simplex]MDM5291766.1 hypothetical protein [Peribacillus simplex]
MKNFKAFLYFFVLSGVFGLTSIYVRENFNKPFSSLDTADITRAIMAGLVEVVCIYLVYDTFSRFKQISKVKKNILIFVGIFSSIFYFLYLVGVYLQ